MTEFGTLVSPWALERAAIATLQSPPTESTTDPRLVYYLAELERQMGLAAQTLGQPPGPSSYRGGVDADTIQAEWMPCLHVIVSPKGKTENLDAETVAATFTVEVAATAGADDEDQARMLAYCYGLAATACLVQRGSFGLDAVVSTMVTAAPSTRLLDPTVRQVVRATSQLETMVAPIMSRTGPTDWPAAPYIQQSPTWPEVSEVDITLTGETLDGTAGQTSSITVQS